MQRLLFLIILIQISIGSCGFPSILSSDDQASSASGTDEPNTILIVETIGGIAGVKRLLEVNEFGKAVFIDDPRFHPGAEWVIQLSQEEINNLVSLFKENDFFQLRDTYFDPQVADAFHYSISFNHGQQSKKVSTDGFAAPTNLQTIIEGVLLLQTRITEKTLAVQLELSADEIVAGDKVDLMLTVINLSDGLLTLRFSSGQIFDFYAARASVSDAITSSSSLDWSWASDKFFTQALQEIELGVDETRTYQITWDGRDNIGQILIGELIVGAELVSVPGGKSSLKRLTIKDRI
ncbi:BsuPI-related putative proteinase inhibitor [bacterium]|nr:BsuPI-related putative proteinase inhibitor [bacterium]